jgi:hypothetical protein
MQTTATFNKNKNTLMENTYLPDVSFAILHLIGFDGFSVAHTEVLPLKLIPKPQVNKRENEKGKRTEKRQQKIKQKIWTPL